MAKRRLISLLPAYNQTADLTNFFGSTVDEVFQPGTSKPISGYIGRRPPGTDPLDFYIGEPTASRSAYQLEAGMVSYDTTGTLTRVLSYPDFIGYLQTSGADVSDHERLFETEYYTWAPPINIDMLVNYRNYYWFGDRNGNADLPILVLTVPITTATGNGSTTTFDLPASIVSVASGDETPAVYVDNLPVSFTVVGDTVVLASPPASGATVLVARTFSLVAAIAGASAVNISDLNINGVSSLTSGMRIKVIDLLYLIGGWDAQPWDYNPWDLAGNGIYMVDGIGLSARFTPDGDLVRGIEAQYVTIDRSSRDTNLWSSHDLWVHKDSFAWADTSALLTPLSQRRATRPIIEFVRDIVMWHDSAQLASNVTLASTTLTFTRDLPDLTGRLVIAHGLANGTKVVSVNGASMTISHATAGPLLAGTTLTFRQEWDESTDPLFMLYNLNSVALNNPTSFPGSNFTGNRIFGFAAGTGIIDPVLHRALVLDRNDYPVFENDTVLDRYTYASGDITGLYQYGTQDTSLVLEPLWHLSQTTTNQGITNGFYDVPLNLEANSPSDDVTTISRSTWIDQFTQIIAGQPELVGNALGDNNYRDTTRDLTLGTSILQHRAPLLKAMLLASVPFPTASNTDISVDLPQVIRYTDQEYNRFRNKFARKLIDLRNRGVVLDTDPAHTWVVTALKAIKRDKNNQFPFALNTIAGDQYFIPPTPTCLGIMPSAVPDMITDTTYSTPVLMILGHDGSFTPAFNDFRDPIMLELERMIYDNLPAQFQTEARPGFDVQNWIGGRFFDPYQGYTIDEVSNILAPMFELWAQQNHFDYRSNKTFDPGDPFTWNYRDVLDRAGNPLPGNWRAIYRWYYGTDAPHLRPWEMLGFLYEPDWWESQYGAAPYTKLNTALWTDLEAGTIQGGPRAGTDAAYARDGLSDIIPVDDAGNLFDPIAAGIVLTNVTTDTASRFWLAGDQGPVENVWRNTPSYRFALAIAGFLMKPARFVEQCWDVLNIGYLGDQWVDLTTLARPLNALQYVHGEVRNGTTIVVTGISQWIADFLRLGGHTSDTFGTEVRGLGVRLIHQMGGFTSSDDMKVVAESFGLLPAEDISTVLYSSPETRTEVYSGVILEWTGRSWRTIGYDARNPYFTIIPPDTNGPRGAISLSDVPEPVIVKWHPNAYFQAGVLAEYLSSVYQCTRGHTSGPQFEQNFWKPRSDLDPNAVRAPRVVTYLSGLNSRQIVPYGSEFYTYQQIADFLLGWQRWLESRGWLFNAMDANGTILNWSLAVREFLSWAQVQWSPGNFIALSPGQQELKFSSPTGTILNVEDSINGFFGLSDRSGRPIGSRDAIVNRLDGDISIHAKNADIYAARLGFADIEHTLVFSNVTIFDDDIYLPLFNMRLTRLRLICKLSRDWSGRLDAPGFMVIGNQLKSDFEKAAEDVRLIFDIDLGDRVDLRNYARHDVGFQTRDYLQNLLLADVEQFEFYQGMIQQKGAPGVFQKLVRSNRASNNSNLKFLEEWAIRIDEFGAPLDPFMTFRLSQLETRDDPQLVRLVPTANAPLDWIVFTDPDPRWVDQPEMPFFTMHTGYDAPSLPTAGPVRLSDADQTVFHIIDVPDLYLPIQQAGLIAFPTGSSTWVYERADGTYTMLRSFEIGASPVQLLQVVTSTEDITITTARLFFQDAFTLTSADIGNYLVIDGESLSSPELMGLVQITAVNLSPQSVDIVTVGTQGHDFTSTPADAPFVRVLREVRFPTRTELLTSGYTFATGALAWIDNDLSSGTWAVLQWDGASWNAIRTQPLRVNPNTISETVIYRATTLLIDQQMITDEPVVNELTVIDPLNNLLAGNVDRDLDYKTNYDPARYTSSVDVAVNPWGPNEIGRVWWNLSTVKFLDPYTDALGVSDERDLAELAYRTANWSHIAPNTSVDIYEWTQSTVDPNFYTGPGTVYNADFPSWSERTMFDPALGAETTVFFFWVKGLTSTPNIAFRHTDITSIARTIANPSSLDLPWMAPIHRDALIVSGISQFLNDTDTVMKAKLTLNPESAERHDEWSLLRPGDDASLPSAQVWQKLRDSLAGFDDAIRPLPDPALSVMRATGVRQPQSMFVVDGPDGPRTGLATARQSFVGIINTIFQRTPFMRDNLALIHTLYRATPIDQYLIWSQIDISYAYEPPPRNEWDVEVFFLDQRNRLLARPDFLDALTSNKKIRVLLNGYVNPLKQWSIWEFDPDAANALIAANPLAPVEVLLVSNADLVFNLALSYEYAVSDMPSRDALALAGCYGIGVYGLGVYGEGGSPATALLVEGDRVLVKNDTDFWAIWKYLPSDPNADSVGFVLWRVQSYRTQDFIEQIDWYAEGYAATNPPVVSYATVTERNLTEGSLPINQFVKIDNDGTGSWVWTQFDVDSGEWATVAVQGGTLGFSSDLYDPTRMIHDVNIGRSTNANASAGDDTLSFADTTGIGLDQFVLGPQFDRSTRVADLAPTSLTLSTPILKDVPTGAKIGFTNFSLDDVANRDGSWEHYILADVICYSGLLDDSQINEIFCSCLNFIHVQQNSLDWAFKTSFMTIVGYNVTLTQTPVLLSDQTDSLLSYVNEVKPYHVKVRSFSTQYNTDIDLANVTIEEDKAFDLTMLFDRYTVDAWDIFPWDSDPWDTGERRVEQPWDTEMWDSDTWDGDITKTYIFVHTVVRETLAEDGPVIAVDDIRFMQSTYVNDVFTLVSADNPLTIRINDSVYTITSVLPDAVNVSTTTHGISGHLIALSAIDAVDGTASNVVEAIIIMPDAALRIFDHYQPTTGMPPNDITVLLNLGLHPNFVSYTVADNAALGDLTLTLASTANIVVGQPVAGPNILPGTIVVQISGSVITLSNALINDLVAPVAISIAMPVDVSGTEDFASDPDFVYDGDALAFPPTLDLSINPPLTSRPGGFSLREPYQNGQPEERVPFNADDCLHMLVTTNDDHPQWMSNSRLPATVRMPPVLDNTGAPVIRAPNHGDAGAQPVYYLRDEYVSISDFTTGTLSADLSADATTIVVKLNASSTSIAAPFSLPKGSIWIGAERIEYFNLSRTTGENPGDPDIITLSQLRRGTRGTSIAEQVPVNTMVYNGDAFILPPIPLEPVLMTPSGASGYAHVSSLTTS